MITNEAQKILKAVADLNDHGIYPSKAEIVRRAFDKLKLDQRREIYELIEFMAFGTYTLRHYSAQGFAITDSGRRLLTKTHV